MGERLVALGVAALVLIAGGSVASAQTISTPKDEGWQFLVVPYLLATAMKGNVTVRGETGDVDLTFSDLFDKVDLIQREPHQSKIKGPDLVVQWVRHYDPSIVVDDREEVRAKIRELHRGIMAYHPNAFLQIEGESDEHPLQE